MPGPVPDFVPDFAPQFTGCRHRASVAPVAELQAIFDHLWRDYVAITPVAQRVHDKLRARGESFGNDHIALRSFDLEPITLDRVAQPFVDAGYQVTGEYHFEQKRLFAKSYSHPSGRWPRVFVSHLLTSHFDVSTQTRIAKIVESLDPAALASPEALLMHTPTWAPVALADYEALLEHSEYAAWVAAFGIRANHFTVHANDLESFDDLAALNAFLVDSGERLNGGDQAIQGDPAQGLEQSSTVADEIEWAFAAAASDASQQSVRRAIPSCYYEFAWRHATANGELFDGFVTGSADKIFESTDVAHHR